MHSSGTASAGAASTPPDPFLEAQRRYAAVRGASDPSSERDRAAESLKSFLAYVDEHRRELGPHGPELAPELDEAAMALYHLSLADLAGRAVEIGLGYAPESSNLLYHKGLILLAQNRNLEFVVPLLDRALEIAPHDRAIWATKGDALRLTGRREGAIEAYLHAQQLDTGSEQYVDRALKMDPRHAGALRVKLKLARAHGGERVALEACESLLKENPKDPELLLARADILVALGQLEEATTTLEAARAQRPDDPHTAEVHVRLLFALRRDGEAREELRQLLERKSALDAAALAEFSDRIAKEDSELPLALAARERLREIEPRNLANLQALRALGLRAGRPELAIDASRAILAASPGNLEAMRGLAELELGAGRPDAAFATYRELARTHPRELGELRRAMVAAQSAGRSELVVEFADAVLKEAPSDLAAQEQRAHALAELGRAAEAFPAVEALLARTPGEFRYLAEKKRLLVELQRSDELGPVLDELTRLDPSRTDLALERGNLYLGRAYRLPEGSVDRANAARAALVSYERASLDPDRRSSSLLGIGRASRVVHLPDRAIPAYVEFLAIPGNERRADAHKEVGHLLREVNRFREADAEYTRAIQLGLEDLDLLWGEVEVLTQLNSEATALRYLELLLIKEPKNPLFLRRKGQLLLTTGRRSEGLEALTEAAQGAPSDPKMHFQIAEVLRTQGAYADAIQYYELGLGIDPKHREGRLQLAQALLQAGRFDEVVPQVDRLLHEDPNDLVAWRLRAEAYRALHRPADLLYSLRAILLLDSHDGRALREKAEMHLTGGQRAEALEAYRQLVEGPGPEANDPGLWLAYADLAREMGDGTNADRGYDRAAQLGPDRLAEISERKARGLLAVGRPELALAAVDGLRLPAGTAPPLGLLLLRAEILGALERPTEAQSVYAEVRTRDPKNLTAALGVGRMLLDQGKPGEARDMVRGILPTAPPTPGLYLLLAEAEGALGQLPEAAAALEEGTRALPQSSALWSRLAEVRLRQEAWPNASDALAHAMALDPKDPDLPLRAGFVAERLGHAHEALALYEHATQIAPDSKLAWSSHGVALLSLGRPQDAVASFDRALGLDSDYEAAKEGRKTAQQRLRDGQVERFGRDALLLEAKIGRPVARNDLFVTLHVPYDLLDPVLEALTRTPKIDLKRLSEEEVRDLEAASCQLVTAALERHPEGIDRRGLALSDVALLAPPSYSLGELQRLFGYVQAVLELELKPENLTLTPEVEELARRALLLVEGQRTLFEIVRTLRVGLFKGRIIKAVESAGGAVHAPLPTVDLGQYTPEFRHEEGPETAEPPSETLAGDPPPSPAFFPADDEAAHAPPILPPPPHRGTEAHLRAAAPRARCVGCGGIAAVQHGCGAALCRACIHQYPNCPKCGSGVGADSTVPIGEAPTPARGPASRSGPLRGILGRAKANLPRRSSPPDSTESTSRASGRGRAATARSAPAPVAPPASPAPAHAGPGKSRPAAPPPEPAPTTSEPAPPAPTPAPVRPARERRDDEPRL